MRMYYVSEFLYVFRNCGKYRLGCIPFSDWIGTHCKSLNHRSFSLAPGTTLMIVRINLSSIIFLFYSDGTREKPAFGGISLALRGSGAIGASGGGKRIIIWGVGDEKKNWAPGTPLISGAETKHIFGILMERVKFWPVPWGFRICTWVWNWTRRKWFL